MVSPPPPPKSNQKDTWQEKSGGGNERGSGVERHEYEYALTPANQVVLARRLDKMARTDWPPQRYEPRTTIVPGTMGKQSNDDDGRRAEEEEEEREQQREGSDDSETDSEAR